MVGAVVMAGVISHWRAGQPSAVAGVSSDAATADEGHAAARPTAAPADHDRYRSIVERELDALDD
jgi:hypothetical protein